MGILAFLIYVVIAAGCAAVAQYLLHGHSPGGFPANAALGIAGAFMGSSMFGEFGPEIIGIALLPTVLGAVVMLCIFELLVYRPRTRRPEYRVY